MESDLPLGARLEAAHAQALGRERTARRAAVEAARMGDGLFSGQREADRLQEELRRNPRPTGRTIDAGGPIRLLALGGASVLVGPYIQTAYPGDLLLVDQDVARRLVSLDGAKEV